MAFKEHVELVTGGREAYKEWRKEHRKEQLWLDRADLSRTDLHRLDLDGADLSEADLSNANLSGAQLSNADLSGARLCGANLSCGHLSGAHLYGADLHQADLRWADLSWAHLYDANFHEADLSKADLRYANLRGVDFRAAHLREASLLEADLRGADLRGADLACAVIGSTILGRIELSETKGLESVTHVGPSTIDLDTLFASLGRIPEAFVRGCGVQEYLIRHLPSLLDTARAIAFCSCFISYSDADESFARQLHDALQHRGIRCWLDRNIGNALEQGLRTRDKVLLCASEHALNSIRVERELDIAMAKECQIGRERGTDRLAIIPLNLDGFLCRWEGAPAAALRKRVAADFTGWENDYARFEAAFETLVRILQVDRSGRKAPPERAP